MQKLHSLNTMSVESSLALAARAGFVSRHASAGQLLVIPAGHIVASVTPEAGSTSRFLRWGMMLPHSAKACTAELELVSTTLLALLDSYPSLAKGTHQAWAQALELMVT